MWTSSWCVRALVAGARRIALPLLFITAASSCSKQGTAESPRAAQTALREFTGSYPQEARPNGQVRSFDIVAEPTEVELLDGRRLRVWAYNGQVPGPQLRIRLGETLRVRFTNKLPQETTIHWHGVRLPNAMDGVPHATQPPVKPGETFVYEFTPKDAGTYWFHPHVRGSEQVERGLYGVLIVEDANPPPYSRDVMWVVDDWLLDPTGQVDPRFNTRHDLSHDGRWGNVITVNGRSGEVLSVRPGERIRLRMLNSSNGRVVMPDFTGLAAKLIAVDGMYLREPIDPAGIELAPGNRIDLDITFNQSLAAPFTVVDRFSSRRPNALANIVIEGEPVEPPQFESPARAHVPAWKTGMDVPEHHTFRLNARGGGPLGIEWTIDGKAFVDHAQHQHEEPILTLSQGQFYRLRYVNESARLHPIHHHGMFFRLLARNGVPVDEPFFRDTVLIRGRETVDIAMVPTDVGSWMVHCHILEHAEAGMMALIDVRAR
ncbi:multicopper oxidase family protein [Myxococcus stipitatus]|uniref:multicopper oxidase family protein n=1 Tax=Myxococcus stipitatus TaxID=83455 RepID=UPI0030D227FF